MITQPQSIHYALWQPISPQRNDEMRSTLFKVRFGQTGCSTVGNHVGGSGPGFLNVFHPKEWLSNQRIARNWAVRLAKHSRSQTRWQFSRIPHLYAIGKDTNLDKAIVPIITVRNSVNYRLRDD